MRLHILSVAAYIVLSQNATQKPTSTEVPISQPTLAPISQPTLAPVRNPTSLPTDLRYTSKACLGPDEGADVKSPLFSKELCGHMEYIPGINPKLDVKVTWGSQLIGSETLSPTLKPKGICVTVHLCQLCMGFDMIEITEIYARVCPTAAIDCVGINMLKFKMDCLTMGDEDKDETGSISHGLTQFGLKLLSSVTLTRDMDAFVAPFSIANVMISNALASRGNTRRQILQTLGIPKLLSDSRALAVSYGGMVNGIKHQDQWVTSVGTSSLWVVKEYFSKISLSFIRNIRTFGEIRKIDLSDATFATGEINAYISELTREHISSAIENDLRKDSVTLFTNIMYFTAQWENPFDIIMTEIFVDSTGSKYEVEMMSTSSLEYSIVLTTSMQMIEVPLKQEFSNFGFFMVRPRLEDMKDTIAVEKELKATEFQLFLDKSVTQHHTLSLPSFTMFYCQDLTDELRLMGVKDVFDPILSNMTELFEERGYTFYEDAFNRQGWIQVNQHGFTIASFAGDGVGKEDNRSGKVMHADKPFIFLVFEKTTSTLMFAGRITNPNGWRMDKNARHRPLGRINWVGFIFGLIFFGTISYCILRCCYNYQFLRLTGSDIIPHRDCLENCMICSADLAETCWDSIVRICPCCGNEEPELLLPTYSGYSGDGYNQL